MNALPLELVRDAVRRFAIDGELVAVEPHPRGHIHDTFVSTWRGAHGNRRYLHQRLNERVFTDLDALMHNVSVVTRHLQGRRERSPSAASFATLELISSREGATWLRDESGPWRTYRYIENTETFDVCPDPSRAHDAARAFGRFQAALADLDSTRLLETIPRFFRSSHRLHQFDVALESASDERKSRAAAEIDFVAARRAQFSVIDDRVDSGEIPSRILHGDTKLNNVLFDRATGRAAAIVDLDTCMPGWSLYDFGDLVRFTAATAKEDELDLSRVSIDLELHRALVRGYLAGARSFLRDEEIEVMPFSARLVTLTVGSRFLADYLNGDVYFKIDPARPSHNLERARVQFALVAAMEAREDEMRAAVSEAR